MGKQETAMVVAFERHRNRYCNDWAGRGHLLSGLCILIPQPPGNPFLRPPTSYTYYLFRHFQKQRVAQHKPFNVLDATPTQLPEMQNLGAEPVIVFVVGETARAENFSLDGYRRTTNPELATVTQLMNFERATSRHRHGFLNPCMFSYDTKDNYDVERAT